MKIRKIQEADLTVLAKLNADIFGDTKEKQALKVFRDCLKNGVRDACLLAEEGEIIGAVFTEKKLTFSEKAAGIKSIFVKKKCRGKGVGRILLGRCVSALRKKGYKSVSLTVDRKNKNAISIYEKSGFRPFRIMYLKEL